MIRFNDLGFNLNQVALGMSDSRDDAPKHTNRLSDLNLPFIKNLCRPYTYHGKHDDTQPCYTPWYITWHVPWYPEEKEERRKGIDGKPTRRRRTQQILRRNVARKKREGKGNGLNIGKITMGRWGGIPMWTHPYRGVNPSPPQPRRRGIHTAPNDMT